MSMSKHIALICLVFPVVCFSQALYQDTLFVPVTFYDFHSDRSNPEFECRHQTGLRRGMVADTLDEEFKPVVGSSPYLNQSVEHWFRDWTYSSQGIFSFPEYSPKAQFRERFSDPAQETGEEVTFLGHDYTNHDTSFKNIVIDDHLTFINQGNGVYFFSSDSFYPLDNKGFGAEWSSAADESPHNHAFTMEMLWKFRMQRGLNLQFEAGGDLWVFINDRLVLDLGGFHEAEQGYVNLDDLGLDEGKMYPMRIFYAQRHSFYNPKLRLSTIQIPLPFRDSIDAMFDISETEVEAGDSVEVKWMIFSDSGLVNDYSGTYIWNVVDTSGLIEKETFDVYEDEGRVVYKPTDAYRSVIIHGELHLAESEGVIRDSVKIDVLPGEPDQVVIELNHDSLFSLRDPAPLDTVRIGAEETECEDIFAILRDQHGNWVSAAFPGPVLWSSVDTSVVDATTGRMVSRGQGLAVRKRSEGGETKIFVTSAQGYQDTVCVVVESSSLPISSVNTSKSLRHSCILFGGQSFEIPEPGRAVVSLFDLSGRKMAVLFEGSVTPGTNVIKAPRLPSGSYLVQVQSGKRVVREKVMIGRSSR